MGQLKRYDKVFWKCQIRGFWHKTARSQVFMRLSSICPSWRTTNRRAGARGEDATKRHPFDKGAGSAPHSTNTLSIKSAFCLSERNSWRRLWFFCTSAQAWSECQTLHRPVSYNKELKFFIINLGSICSEDSPICSVYNDVLAALSDKHHSWMHAQ